VAGVRYTTFSVWLVSVIRVRGALVFGRRSKDVFGLARGWKSRAQCSATACRVVHRVELAAYIGAARLEDDFRDTLLA